MSGWAASVAALAEHYLNDRVRDGVLASYSGSEWTQAETDKQWP